jgi:hypothetical protein
MGQGGPGRAGGCLQHAPPPFPWATKGSLPPTSEWRECPPGSGAPQPTPRNPLWTPTNYKMHGIIADCSPHCWDGVPHGTHSSPTNTHRHGCCGWEMEKLAVSDFSSAATSALQPCVREPPGETRGRLPSVTSHRPQYPGWGPGHSATGGGPAGAWHGHGLQDLQSARGDLPGGHGPGHVLRPARVPQDAHHVVLCKQ